MAQTESFVQTWLKTEYFVVIYAIQ